LVESRRFILKKNIIALSVILFIIITAGFFLHKHSSVSSNYTVPSARADFNAENELEGYRDYAEKVRYRLVPGLW
jgi:hypothetical protein